MTTLQGQPGHTVFSAPTYSNLVSSRLMKLTVAPTVQVGGANFLSAGLCEDRPMRLVVLRPSWLPSGIPDFVMKQMTHYDIRPH